MPIDTIIKDTLIPEVVESISTNLPTAPDSTTAEKTAPVDPMTQRTIISPTPAIEDVNKIQGEVAELDKGMAEQTQKLEAEPVAVNIKDIAIQKGMDSDFASLEKLANQYGIPNYIGTPEQNTQLAEILNSQPKPKELTPEEKKTQELKKAIIGEEEKPPVEEEIPPTPEEILTKQIEDNSNKIDEAYQNYKSDINKLSTGQIPMTPEEQAEFGQINRAFDELKGSQLIANKNFENAMRIAGITSGRQRYAPEIEAGNIAKAVNLGIKKVAELETKRIGAVNELKSAIRDKNYAEINNAYDRFREYSNDKMNAMKDIYTIAEKAQAKVDAEIAAQEKEEAEYQKELDKQKADVIKDASKNGASPEVISAIQGAETLADAVNMASEFLQTGSGVVGEYLFYKREQEAQGLPYVDFNTYSTMDANRKRSITNLISGLDPKIASQVDTLSKSYDNSPIVKNFNDVLNKKISIDSIVENGIGGPADLALVFEFMKSLDPTSVVRESEYESAAKSGNIFKGWAAKFNGYMRAEGGFLPPEVKNEFQKITGLKFDVIKSQYDNIRKETARRINMKTGDVDGKDYLIDYDITTADMVKDSQANSEGSLIEYMSQSPENQTQVESIINENPDLSDEDILQILNQ